MLKLVAIAFLLGGCSVMTEACCPPKQFECTIGVQNATIRAGKLDVSTTAFMHSVDLVNKKVAYVGQGFKMMQDYNKMMQYTISHGFCTTGKLTTQIHNCMPANATIATSLDMGGPKGVTLDVYDIEKISPGPGLLFKGTLTFNRDGCIPFSETLMTEGSIATLGYINITSGIKDPSVFDVPSPPCPKDTDNFVNLLQEQPTPSWPILPKLP
ncbi:ependymin-related protein 1-like isoform X3 [Branchiostoma lanceolatum]|uniref:ependymin-related protein 1-like isoform X3 n=1 Tax=Branchiostoma lanceolatum TaxID=7740 RepID=UPI003455AEFB